MDDGLAVDNAALAELLALAAQDATAHVARAYRRASRKAFTWAEEAADLHAQGRSLTELSGIGPFLERDLVRWIEEGEAAPPPPPERANFLTLARARRVIARGPVPRVRGDLQMHTTWSDGGSPLEEMAAAAEARSYEYIAITDHSAGLRIVRGLDEAALARQGAEIDAINVALAGNGSELHVLRSVEMNLNPAGEGDLEASALAKLDLVLGSFHSALRRTEDQTDRYLAAVRNPDIDVLAHPRGRIYNHRLGLTADWARVFAAAADADVALEIDSYPDRQDLDVELLRIARDSGVRISIGTDAHHHPQLEWIDLGIAAADEAGIAHDRILNTMTRDELVAWARNRRP